MGLRNPPACIPQAKTKRRDQSDDDWCAEVNPDYRMTLLIDSSFLIHWLLRVFTKLAVAIFQLSPGDKVIDLDMNYEY
jgi:hypothetical protein